LLYLLGLALSKTHRVTGSTHTSWCPSSAAKEEKASEESSREDKTLCEFPKSTRFLLRQNGHINLSKKKNLLA